MSNGKASIIAFFLWIGLLALFINACEIGVECKNGIQSPCIPVDKPHANLSDYNLYEGALSDLDPVANLLPYDLNTQLFSDYAQKQRFVYVPPDSSVAYNDQEVLEFPVGSMLVKNFYYDLDQTDNSSDREIIETRLLMRKEMGWTAETYVWNEDQTEAFLQQAGDQKEVTWTNQEGITRNVKFLIPTKNDCKTCHSHNNELFPLGPEVRNLNKTYPYEDGPENQLIKWEQAGILSAKPDLQSAPEVPVWDDSSTGSLEQRDRIYLDVNCANCHSRGGSASHSGLFLNYRQDDPFRLGVMKPPVAAGTGSGGLNYSIVPGQPDQSILVYRMESVHPAVRMPEIGRTLVHEEAVELIRQWIRKMEAEDENSK
jgi:uncharacterized repeat protein (TIGR03806 family)